MFVFNSSHSYVLLSCAPQLTHVYIIFYIVWSTNQIECILLQLIFILIIPSNIKFISFQVVCIIIILWCPSKDHKFVKVETFYFYLILNWNITDDISIVVWWLLSNRLFLFFLRLIRIMLEINSTHYRYWLVILISNNIIIITCIFSNYKDTFVILCNRYSIRFNLCIII